MTTVRHAPVVVRPPLAEYGLNMPDSDINAMSVTLERDDTEQETPYVGISNSRGWGVDFTSPEDVRAYAQQIRQFAERVDAVGDRLAAEQARTTAQPVPAPYSPPLAEDGLPQTGPDEKSTIQLDLGGLRVKAEIFVCDDADASAVITAAVTSPDDSAELSVADAERVLADLPAFAEQLRGLVAKLADYQGGAR